MNRLFLMASAATLPLVVDASLKSVALLVLAAIAGLLMRRSSAAARHMVWLAAVLALLLVPVLSVVLPGWRVLPEWAAVATGKTTPDASGTDNSHGTYAAYESSFPAVVSPMPVLENPVTAVAEAPLPPTTAPAPAPVAVATPLPVPPSSFPGGWFLSAWAAGCALLLLRLSAAHWLLHRAARHSRGTDEPLAGTFAAALKESGVRQQVRLLVDSRRTIPVAWGIFRPRLLLPEEAVSWDEGQLRSVFMHELAHLRRRDPLVQFLTQVACALHWFNPLVWLAAWRLHVERERACDDLVLASGVRPSEYAGHLLHVATQLSPARWTAGCGLAMARKSSLEGRLLAVLSNNLNRRGVTRILAIAAILLGAAIAVPVAMLRAAEKKPAASPDTVAAESPDVSKMQVGEATGMEKNLKWGEPVNGLRAAVAFLATSPTKPKPGDLQELFLALQNVSKAPLRLSDADLGSKDPSRHLYLKVKGEIKFGLGSNTPALGDLTLQPGEIKTLLMFTPVPSKPDGPSIGQLMTEGAVKDTHQTLMMELKIEKAPAGAWTGTLRTGDASAYEAQGQPLPKDKKAQELFNLW
ncbi:MAG TPA: M56 family metallopeptidase, partial [Verrucomicrobiales bacterium]|nr:M56 family metallopeptidase [Verrucomicrobiales bacterium]